VPSPTHDAIVTPIDISVIIPAYGGKRTIARCLNPSNARIAGKSAEVIVVGKLRRRRGGDHPRAFSAGDGDSIPRAIERGCRAATGRGSGARAPGVSDGSGCVVPPDWIDRLGRFFSDPAVGAAGGIGRHSGSEQTSARAACTFWSFLYHFPSFGAARAQRQLHGGLQQRVLATGAEVRAVSGSDAGRGHPVFAPVIEPWLLDDLRPGVEIRHHNRTGWGEFFNYNRKMGKSAAAYHNSLQLR
jgi:hypothetical protein